MRPTLSLMIAFALIAAAAFAAPAPPKKAPTPDNQTQIEKTINRRGELYMKDVYEAGLIPSKYSGSLKMNLIIISYPDQADAPKEFGIRFDYQKSSTDTESGESEVGYLDYDEAKDLSKGIGDMQTMAAKMAVENHENTEIHYKTRDGMDFGFLQTTEGQTGYVEINDVACFLTMDNFQSLRASLDQAVSRLKDKGAGAASTAAAPQIISHERTLRLAEKSR